MGIFKKISTERQLTSTEKKHKLIASTDSAEASTKEPKNTKQRNEKSEQNHKSPNREKSPKSNTDSRKKSKKKHSPRSSRSKKRKTAKRKKDTSEGNFDTISVVYPASNAGLKYPPIYFRDGVRKVDFILVTTRQIVENPESLKLINIYVENLKSKHLLYEFEYGKIINNLFFIKINVTDSHIEKLAAKHHINLTCLNPNYNHDKPIKSKCLQNDLNTPYMKNPLFNRSSSVAGDRPAQVTDAERSLIAYKVLAETSYGGFGSHIGHVGLVKDGIFIDAYPLHDQTYHWSIQGPLSDRQLLRKYWANFSEIFKIQPLNLIEIYLGTANAFYFAWVGFYIKMLSIASLLGLVFFIIGGIYFTMTVYGNTLQDVCNSDVILCPACKDLNICKFIKLKYSCDLMIASYFIDNDITIIFAIIMSVWSTLFMVYWKRYESRLNFRWNVSNLTVDTCLRYEYLEVATKQKILPNGDPYLIIPKRKRFFHIILTYSTCLFLVAMVVAILFGYIIYCVGVRYTIYISQLDAIHERASFIVSITGSIFIYCFIGLFGKIYETIALVLTKYEYHRTDLEHDNSYAYKIIALSFANNYAAITYLAFFKGTFYTHPGNNDNVHILFGLGEDLCDPAGCLIDLTIQLASIMVSRSIVSLIDQFVIPFFKYKFNELRYHRMKAISTPHWEDEFVLGRTSKYDLIHEWTSMLIQYGFVTFYVAALPIAPLIAWLNNILELRVDAIKMIATKRRPVIQRISGIGPYKGILKAMTIAGIATNAFVLAFTTDFIPRFMFAVSDDANHYKKAKLSKFALSDFPNYTTSAITAGQTVCYYPGRRHPPGHEKQYTLTEDYWIELTARFAFVLIFEHVLVTFTGFLSYAIPKQSLSLQIESSKQEITLRQVKNKVLNIEREKQRRWRRFAFRSNKFGKSKTLKKDPKSEISKN